MPAILGGCGLKESWLKMLSKPIMTDLSDDSNELGCPLTSSGIWPQGSPRVAERELASTLPPIDLGCDRVEMLTLQRVRHIFHLLGTGRGLMVGRSLVLLGTTLTVYQLRQAMGTWRTSYRLTLQRMADLGLIRLERTKSWDAAKVTPLPLLKAFLPLNILGRSISTRPRPPVVDADVGGSSQC